MTSDMNKALDGLLLYHFTHCAKERGWKDDYSLVDDVFEGDLLLGEVYVAFENGHPRIDQRYYVFLLAYIAPVVGLAASIEPLHEFMCVERHSVIPPGNERLLLVTRHCRDRLELLYNNRIVNFSMRYYTNHHRKFIVKSRENMMLGLAP